MGKKYSLMNPEEKRRTRETQRIWREKNREKDRAYKKKSYLKHKDYFMLLQRDRDYIKRYGITLKQYNKMSEDQNGVCLICGADKGGPKTPNLAVDHCHKTGKVRGLLCLRCNSSLGWYEKRKDEINKYLNNDNKTNQENN